FSTATHTAASSTLSLHDALPILSAAGYQSARDIMRLNEHALEITGKPEEYSEWFYWISLFGEPAPDAPWGWQIDGHHLNLNCFVDRKSTRLNSSHRTISYAVFCL